MNINWEDEMWWRSISEIEQSWMNMHNEEIPWQRIARAGLEYYMNPDTGEPDWRRKELICKLYLVENGVAAPWDEWVATIWEV